ncbi:MAG: efflux RND transporter periplasmic adaptor subunit [Myxococcota bacterium]
MIKRILLSLVALVFIVVPLIAIKAGQIMAMVAAGESFAPPPEAVTLAAAETTTWQTRVRAVGTVRAAKGVVVSTDSPGIVRNIGFESGATVKAGQVLVRLDTSVEYAELQSAVAAAKLAQINFDRVQKLNARKFSADSAVQDSEAAKLQADARVAQARAVISRKTITAPFSGRLGIRQVDLGQFLNVGSPVVELVSTGSVYVDFRLPQRYLANIVPGLEVSVSADAFGEQTFSGRIESVEARVEESSRNVRYRATLENSDAKLRDGMFVNLEVSIPEEKSLVVVPTTAIIYAPYGNSVYVVSDDDGQLVANQRFVRIGERRGDFVAILEGLTGNERVVSAGGFKLRNGAAVKEAASDVDPQLDPKPADQ